MKMKILQHTGNNNVHSFNIFIFNVFSIHNLIPGIKQWKPPLGFAESLWNFYLFVWNSKFVRQNNVWLGIWRQSKHLQANSTALYSVKQRAAELEFHTPLSWKHLHTREKKKSKQSGKKKIKQSRPLCCVQLHILQTPFKLSLPSQQSFLNGLLPFKFGKCHWGEVKPTVSCCFLSPAN